MASVGQALLGKRSFEQGSILILSAEQLLSQNQEPLRSHPDSLVTWENSDLLNMIRYDDL